MSYPDTRGINPNNIPKENTKDEINKLIRDYPNDLQAFQKIKEKHGDQEVVNRIFNEYESRMKHIKRKAQKFAQLILTRYNHLGTQRIMEKARKLKTKYGFTDDEYHAFVNIALSDKNISATNQYNVPNTPLSKTLGYSPETNMGKLYYKQDEAKYLAEILAIHQSSTPLHNQVIAQSLTYKDMAPEALTGKFDRGKSNAYNYIHPVVAALFLPRIKYLDEHLIIGSISNIIVHKNNGMPIKIQPDWELYYDMITDPNEVACIGIKENSMLDLLNRVKLQVELWKVIRDLRNGRYYPSDVDAINFTNALEQCKSGFFDSPDMTFVKDEGTILRRLMGAFSLRPTIISITPYGGAMPINYPMNPYSLTQVTSIPIVNFRLPLNINNDGNNNIDLQEALIQPDMYVENKMIVVKVKNIIYSRDFIVFYVNRRYQNINFARLVAPYNFTMLPTSLSGFETINEVQVNYPNVMTIGDDTFNLRSVVMIEKSCFNRDPIRDNVKEIIVGSSAGIVVPEDATTGRLTKTCFIYDPQSAAIKFESDGGVFEERAPITWVPYTGGMYGPNDLEPFDVRASKRGTIYVYVKPNAYKYCQSNICN